MRGGVLSAPKRPLRSIAQTNKAADGPPCVDCVGMSVRSGRQRHFRSDLALAGRVVMILQAILVANHLAIELVHQLVDGGIEVFMRLLDEDVLPLHMESDFGFLSTFLFLEVFHGEQHVHIDDGVEVSRDPVQLGQDVFAQCRCHFQMMAADRQIHQCLLSSESCETWPGGWISGSTVPANRSTEAPGTSPLCAPTSGLTSLLKLEKPGYIHVL